MKLYNKFYKLFYFKLNMKKGLTILFLILMIFGIIASTSLILADKEKSSENNSEKNSVISSEQERKSVSEMTATQIQEAIQARNRLRINQSELPENCTQTGPA